MEHHIDRCERLARWILLASTTAVLGAVVEAIVVGNVSYWAGGVTATAFYALARLAEIFPPSKTTLRP